MRAFAANFDAEEVPGKISAAVLLLRISFVVYCGPFMHGNCSAVCRRPIVLD